MTNDAEAYASVGAMGALISHNSWYRGDSASPDFGKIAKTTDLSDGTGLFIETRSPAEVNIMASVPGTEVERVRLHAMLGAGVSPDAGRPSASTTVKV